MTGEVIRTVAASTFLFSTQNIENPRDTSETWLTTGLWAGTRPAERVLWPFDRVVGSLGR